VCISLPVEKFYSQPDEALSEAVCFGKTGKVKLVHSRNFQRYATASSNYTICEIYHKKNRNHAGYREIVFMVPRNAGAVKKRSIQKATLLCARCIRSPFQHFSVPLTLLHFSAVRGRAKLFA